MVFGPMVDITLITAVLAVLTQFVQNKFIDKDQMKRQQEEIKQKQKKMQELMKKGDPKSKNELEQMEKEMLETMQKMMGASSKVMVASMVIVLPAYFLLGMLYANDIIKLPIPIPWLANGFDLFNISTWGIDIYHETNWVGWYFLSYIVISIILNVARDAMKKKAK